MPAKSQNTDYRKQKKPVQSQECQGQANIELLAEHTKLGERGRDEPHST